MTFALSALLLGSALGTHIDGDRESPKPNTPQADRQRHRVEAGSGEPGPQGSARTTNVVDWAVEAGIWTLNGRHRIRQCQFEIGGQLYGAEFDQFEDSESAHSTTWTGPWRKTGGLDVRAEFAGSKSMPILRLVIELRNPGDAPIETSVRLVDLIDIDDRIIVSTSSGDLISSRDDHWIITAAHAGLGNDARVEAWILSGPDNPDVKHTIESTKPKTEENMDLASSEDFGDPEDGNTDVTYALKINSEQSAILMIFLAVADTNAEGHELASEFNASHTATYQLATVDIPTQKLDLARNWVPSEPLIHESPSTNWIPIVAIGTILLAIALLRFFR